MRLAFIEPLLPTLVEKPPEGDEWIHEVKFDGYRSQIVIDDAGVRIFTRNGLDWTAKYRDLVEAAKQLPVTSAIIDGEIVVLNEAGLSDFGALRKAINRRQHDLYFVAFDLLHLDGHDLRDMALEERREILHALIQPDSGSSSASRCRAMRRPSST
jgi:bifunctional non-homologous end joining protein LigD